MQNNVEKFRKQLGWSQCQLAEKCGFITKGGYLNNANIVRIEQGRSLNLHTAKTVYNVFYKEGLCHKFEDLFHMIDSN